MRDSLCQLSCFSTHTCANLKCMYPFVQFKFSVYGHTQTHTHASCNAVPLVWHSLRFASMTVYLASSLHFTASSKFINSICTCSLVPCSRDPFGLISCLQIPTVWQTGNKVASVPEKATRISFERCQTTVDSDAAKKGPFLQISLASVIQLEQQDKQLSRLQTLILAACAPLTDLWSKLCDQGLSGEKVALSPARAKNGEAPGTHCLRMRLISPRCGDSGLFSDSSVSCDVGVRARYSKLSG